MGVESRISKPLDAGGPLNFEDPETEPFRHSGAGLFVHRGDDVRAIGFLVSLGSSEWTALACDRASASVMVEAFLRPLPFA